MTSSGSSPGSRSAQWLCVGAGSSAGVCGGAAVEAAGVVNPEPATIDYAALKASLSACTVTLGPSPLSLG
eukprot:11198178-Lingulodinium_polyedra.AAC.1